MPVIDASVLVAYLGQVELGEVAGERIAADRDSLYAPHLIDAEVGHALRRLVGAGEVVEAEAELALEELADLPLRRAEHTWLLSAAWRLRSKLSFY